MLTVAMTVPIPVPMGLIGIQTEVWLAVMSCTSLCLDGDRVAIGSTPVTFAVHVMVAIVPEAVLCEAVMTASIAVRAVVTTVPMPLPTVPHAEVAEVPDRPVNKSGLISVAGVKLGARVRSTCQVLRMVRMIAETHRSCTAHAVVRRVSFLDDTIVDVSVMQRRTMHNCATICMCSARPRTQVIHHNMR